MRGLDRSQSLHEGSVQAGGEDDRSSRKFSPLSMQRPFISHVKTQSRTLVRLSVLSTRLTSKRKPSLPKLLINRLRNHKPSENIAVTQSQSEHILSASRAQPSDALIEQPECTREAAFCLRDLFK